MSRLAPDIAGFVASVLVLATFVMTNMRTLRVVAIFSNLAFILYGAMEWLPPVICLHTVLLPVNLVRLAQTRTGDAPALRCRRANHAGPWQFGRSFGLLSWLRELHSRVSSVAINRS